MSACVLWPGSKDQEGYGWFKVFGKRYRANRVALELNLHRELLPGMVAMHTCDVPACINPEHLLEGTPGDNNRDCTAKGRNRWVYQDSVGESNGRAKLTEADVKAIRLASARGVTGAALAERYGVTPPLISQIRLRRIWKHV